VIGRLSDLFVAGGASSGRALRDGMLTSLVSLVFAAIFLLLAGWHVGRDERTRLDRARAAGEPGL
jgi:hypothetical protein